MTADTQRFLRLAMMALTRAFDARFESLLLTGRVSKWYSEVGNEATTVPAGLALEPGDVLCSLHRDLGAILATYLDPARAFPDFGFGEPDGLRPDPQELLSTLACQLLGKDEGFSRGVERSFHYAHMAPDQGIRHIGMISHLGSMIPVAAGCAFALREAGEGRLAVNFIGDGGTSTGDFHEGLNMAAVWKLPLILVIENNRFAFSTPTSQQYAADRLSDRGKGYGIPAWTVDGNDADAMAEAIRRASQRARNGEGPTLIEAMLGRIRGHSEGDDSLKVVPPEDLDRYRAEDPLPSYFARLRAEGVVSTGQWERTNERVELLVETAIEAGLAATAPKPETAVRPVFASRLKGAGPIEHELAGELGDFGSPKGLEPGPNGPLRTYVEAVHEALSEEMARDESIVLMGQDIGAFEGAFRVTRGLFARWPKRVLDTPIAESGTIGIAVGASLLGHRPVVEMQFADFISCGFNQLVNVAAKLYYRWQIPCPIVVRLPSGGGVGAGPFHSQNPEAWFAHVAGLKVVCPASASDAKGLLKAAIRDPNPVLFFEHKFLYRRVKEVLPGDDFVVPLGQAKRVLEGRDVTLIAYGSSVSVCMEAAKQMAEAGSGSRGPASVEVIDLRTLVPLDEEAILRSVKKTGRAIVVHEAQLTGGFGAEVAALISQRAFSWLDAPVARVAYPDRPVPFAKVLEKVLLPSVQDVVEAVRRSLDY